VPPRRGTEFLVTEFLVTRQRSDGLLAPRACLQMPGNLNPFRFRKFVRQELTEAVSVRTTIHSPILRQRTVLVTIDALWALGKPFVY
jgi:hypothetical protein